VILFQADFVAVAKETISQRRIVYCPLLKSQRTAQRWAGLAVPPHQALLPKSPEERPNEHLLPENRAFLQKLLEGLESVLPSIVRALANTLQAFLDETMS
jgi:hypothetical protein